MTEASCQPGLPLPGMRKERTNSGSWALSSSSVSSRRPGAVETGGLRRAGGAGPAGIVPNHLLTRARVAALSWSPETASTALLGR
ncbi:MAG: hypothetical protein A2V88_05730 [Elusimicrobia bacterium RBG_16_66_12]|nr:MAG: hypothetical protein A2V88_05730 [Elusimicrobia bacterium RBG_16_66_12]